MKKKIATRPISGFDELDAAGIGAGYRGMAFEQEPEPEAKIEPKGRTWGEAATDLGAGALQGALGVARLGARVGDAFTHRQGDENPAIRFLNEYGDAVDMQKSEKLREEEQKSQQAVAAAGQRATERFGDGVGGKVARFGAEFGTGAYEAVSNPTLLANSLAEQIPMMGTMKAGQKAAELLAKGATSIAPRAMATSVGQRIAGNAGLGGAVATGMALQGSDIKGETYKRMMELPLEMWRQNPVFNTLAKSIGEDAAKIEIAGRESSKAGWQSAGTSLATSFLPGGTAMERALVGGKKIPIAAVPQAIAGEFSQEGIEEGTGRLAGNNAVSKINTKQDMLDGVGGATGQGGAVGGILGGGSTLARVGLQNYGNKQPPEDPAIAAAKLLAEQQAAAKKAAVSAAHTAAATPNSPIARAAAATNPLTPEEAWAKAQELDAQAALDEANGVTPADPLASVPPAAPVVDPIEETQKVIDAGLAQAKKDKAAQRAAADTGVQAPVDPMQAAANDVVKATGRASISTVQRHLKIAYNHAGRLIEQMERDGLVSPAGPDGTRQVLQQTAPEATTEPAPQQEEQFPPAQPGDILSKVRGNKPFLSMDMAMRTLNRLGDGHEVVRVDGGLAIRPKAAAPVAAPAQEATETVAPSEVERYQWQRNAEGGQERGNQQTIQPLTEALFNEYIAPKVAVKSYRDYQQQFPAATHISLVQKADGSVELGAGGVGPIEKLRPSAAPVEKGWVKAVDSFDSPEAVAHGSSADSAIQPKPLAGQPIDKDWTAFHPESGTLNVPRADMPQIKSENRGALVNFLKARGIDSTHEEVPTESLKPTQTEYSPEKVGKAKGFTGNDRSILVSSDGHVLDGHHQWVAKHEAGEPVKVIRLDAPIDALLSAVREFPSAETTVNSTTQEKANEKAPKTEQEPAKQQAATGAEPVNAAEPDQPAAEPAGASPSEVDLTTVEGVARAVQLKVATNRRKSREKSRKEREAKGYAPNSTPESEQADYEAEISAPPSDMQKQSAAAMLGADPLPLIRMFVNGNFEASEDVFKAITGVKIRGLSAAAKKAALYQWAKWTPEQIAQAEGDVQARKDEAAEKYRQDDLKSAVTGAWLGLDRLKVNLKSGDTITGQDFILQSVAGGFDKAHSQKKGAAVIYGLTDGARFTTLKVPEFTKFVKASIAFGGLDKALAYVNPPKPQAPEGFVDRSIDIGGVKDDGMTAKAFSKPDAQLPVEGAAPAPQVDAPSAEPVPRPKNWENNYGEASKIAEGLNIALRGANGKMKKVPELVAEIKAADAGGKPSPDGDGQHDDLDSEMRAYEERATRIESTLANGGHVVGDQLRSNNGMGLMKLTPAELTRIPANKVREKPDPEKARVDTVKNQPKIDTSAEPVQKPAESEQATPNPVSERKSRIASALDNGGHVVGSELRDRNGLRLLILTPEELADMPGDKIRTKPDANMARTQSSASEQVDAPQIEWTRTRNVDRMGIALKAGFKEAVAESLSKRAWSSLDVVVQEKLAGAMAEQAAPSSDPAERVSTTHAGLKIYPVRVNIGGDPADRWGVQTLNNAEREKNGERQIGGDPLAETLDQAKTLAEQEVATAKTLEKHREELQRVEQEKSNKDAAEKTAFDESPVGRFIAASDYTPMRKGAATLALKKLIGFNGASVETHQFIESLVADGYAPTLETENRIADKSRREWNRMDDRQQREHERKVKNGGTVEMAYMVNGDSQYSIGKTEYAYAKFLHGSESIATGAPAMDAVREASYSFVKQQKDAAESKAITQEDVKAAERQALGVIEAAIDQMKGESAQRFAAKFLPSMGVPFVMGKEKLKAAMADPKINLLAAASDLGIEFAHSVRAALLAKFEGRIATADATPSQAMLNQLLNVDSRPLLNDLDAATHDVDIGFLKALHDKLRDLDIGASHDRKLRKQDRIGYVLQAIQAKETGKGGLGAKKASNLKSSSPAAQDFIDGKRDDAPTIEEVKAEQETPSQTPSNTIKSSPSEDAAIEAKTTIEQLDAQIKRHEELLGCLG